MDACRRCGLEIAMQRRGAFANFQSARQHGLERSEIGRVRIRPPMGCAVANSRPEPNVHVYVAVRTMIAARSAAKENDVNAWSIRPIRKRSHQCVEVVQHSVESGCGVMRYFAGLV